MKEYGKTDIESETEQTIRSRQIVKEIINFGVTDFQKVKIMELLSLELESRDLMLKIVNFIKDLDKNQTEEKQKIITLD